MILGGFEGRKVAVFGLARTGLTAARALAAAGADVLASATTGPRRRRPATPSAGRLTERLVGLAALMLSPGVPLTHPAPHWTAERAGRRRRDPRRHRALRPHGAPGSTSAGWWRHRHQRQVDHHRLWSTSAPSAGAMPWSAATSAWASSASRTCTAARFRAGDVLLPARPDLQPARRRHHRPQHLARPPGPARDMEAMSRPSAGSSATRARATRP